MQHSWKGFAFVPRHSLEGTAAAPTTTEFETGILFHFGFQSADIHVNQRQKNGHAFLFLVCL
jgi:hypothetical protein